MEGNMYNNKEYNQLFSMNRCSYMTHDLAMLYLKNGKLPNSIIYLNKSETKNLADKKNTLKLVKNKNSN